MELGRLGLAWGRSDLKSGRNLSAVENSWPVKADLTCCLRSPSQSRSFALTRRPANHLSVLLSLYQPRPQTAIEKYRQQLRNCRADFSSFSLRSLSGKHGGGGWELCCLSALLVILRCQSTKSSFSQLRQLVHSSTWPHLFGAAGSRAAGIYTGNITLKSMQRNTGATAESSADHIRCR